eukprot:6171320-Prymnesium_polylepis.1
MRQDDAPEGERATERKDRHHEAGAWPRLLCVLLRVLLLGSLALGPGFDIELADHLRGRLRRLLRGVLEDAHD